MSTQLIIYPQTHNGQYNTLSANSNEFIVNGINFTALSLSTSYDTTNTGNSTLDAMVNAPPTMSNTWFRFRTTVGGTPALPTNTSGNLVLNSIAAVTFSGVYQMLSNLTVGQSYTITISVSTPSTGVLAINLYNGTTPNGGANLFQASVSSHTHTFTATSQNDVFFLSYLNGVATNVVIGQISIVPTGTQPSGIDTVLQDGQVICDLYEDENIPLTLSVDDFKNAAEKVQSYSKAFKLPGTKRNNLIFDNIFEVTRSDNGLVFNPYVKTKSVLKQDGFILFEGYLRLIDIQDMGGEISYNVNLYSEVVAFADVLKQRTFSDLNFTELGHDYNITNILNSWEGILPVAALPITSFANNTGVAGATTTNVLAYPFCDWEHNMTEDATTGFPNLQDLESAFRPFIRIKYLIQKIFEQTDFTFESNFFNTTDFQGLFMDFNWGDDSTPTLTASTSFSGLYVLNQGDGAGPSFATTSFQVLKLGYNIPFIGSPTPPNYNDVTDIITTTQADEFYNVIYTYNSKNNDSAPREIEMRWLVGGTTAIDATPPIGSATVITIAAGGTFVYTGTFNQFIPIAGTTLKAEFRTDVGAASQVGQAAGTFAAPGAYVEFVTGVQNVTTNTVLQTLRGELGQWDFIKGIMTMFNLVTIPDKSNPNNIIIEPYADIFINNSDAQDLDWTDKVDVEEIKLTPLTELNKKTIFKFVEDDDDYIFNVYKNSIGGHLYGSKVFDASTSSNNLETLLTGTDEIVAEPFAATVIKPLMTQFPDLLAPAIYSYDADTGESKGFDNSPRIMFSNYRKPLTTCQVHVPSQNGVSDFYMTDFLQFSHLSVIPTVTSNPPVAADTTDFHFGECQLIEPTGNAVPANLFNNFWLPYYAELYNPDTRIMSLKVNLSAGDLNTFNFFDRVMIKNREYRVNKIDYKPNSLATVEFILLI